MDDEYENIKYEAKDRSENSANFHSNRTFGAEKTDAAPPVSSKSRKDWSMDMSTGEIPLEEPKKWKMPEPVFRVSSGTSLDKPKPPPPVEQMAVSEPPPSQINEPPARIQPQPDIPEEIAIGDPDLTEEPPAEVKNDTGRIILIIAGVLAMAIFAIGFLIGVYFLFFHHFGV